MSSIASETNSVQVDSLKETQANREATGKQEPSGTQKTNENQIEELHIAEGTTNNAGEQSESRQSGAEHPGEETASAEQDFCKTGPSERPNKYKYATFEGYAGERYLQEIVKDILPTALARTWTAAVSYQAPGNVCYVGVSRLAQRERIGERKIQKDLQALHRRGLLKTYSSWMAIKQEDGSWSQRAIIAKDFSRLYDLAYEYHLWQNAEGYIPAEWEYADLIRENNELYKKLVRFDNYRRILCCEKPGRREQLTELEEHYLQYEQEQPQEKYGLEGCNPNKYMSKQINICSPYRESKNPLESIKQENSDSSEDSEERVFTSLESVAIRNEQVSDYTGKGRKDQIINKIEEKAKELNGERIEKNEGIETYPIESLKYKENMPETAKEEEEYTIEDLKRNPVAMTAFLLQLHEQERQKQQREQAKKENRHHKNQSKRQRRGTPEQLARSITHTVQQLGNNPKYLQSDITRVTKIYWACTQIFHHFTNVWFLEQLTNTFVKTGRARKVHNRVAYFFRCLENDLELTPQELAYIRSQEPLYQDGDLNTFVLDLEQRYHRSGSQLDFSLWVEQTYLSRQSV